MSGVNRQSGGVTLARLFGGGGLPSLPPTIADVFYDTTKPQMKLLGVYKAEHNSDYCVVASMLSDGAIITIPESALLNARRQAAMEAIVKVQHLEIVGGDPKQGSSWLSLPQINIMLDFISEKAPNDRPKGPVTMGMD